VSRRKQRAREAGGAGRVAPREQGAAGRAPRATGAARRAAGSRWGLAFQVGFAVAVFAVVTLLAELAGAANLGVSFGIGQIAFAIAVAYLLVRR
jgi:hypothetical protein